jgi:hypothetical protein
MATADDASQPVAPILTPEAQVRRRARLVEDTFRTPPSAGPAPNAPQRPRSVGVQLVKVRVPRPPLAERLRTQAQAQAPAETTATTIDTILRDAMVRRVDAEHVLKRRHDAIGR